MTYQPKPIDTSNVQLPAALLALIEQLAENAHNLYARQRMGEGWRYGPQRNDVTKENPTLVPYQDLPESEKEYDRQMAMETLLKVIIALGYRIEKI
jgi:RyR domain